MTDVAPLTDVAGAIGNASSIAVVAPLTCGSCRHWRAHPLTANNLGGPRIGNCHEGPPHSHLVGSGRIFAAYPPLPAHFEACDRHEARLEVS